MSNKYTLGIDIGSTTVKIAILDENDTLLFADYQRHFANIQETLAELLAKAYGKLGELTLHPVITGSGGLTLANHLGVPFVQEVIAVSTSLQKIAPQTDVAIELGGEDAKIIYFEGGNIEQRMNGICAGGTGSFIDQMASLLQTDATGLNEYAKNYKALYPIAARCGVFAKTDIQPLINDGATKEDLSASIFQAVVNQTISGLACGKPIRGHVAFLGGPLHFLDQLKAAFIRTLKLDDEHAITPENSHLFAAMGSAMNAKDEVTVSLTDMTNRLKNSIKLDFEVERMEPLFATEEDYEAFNKRQSAYQVKKGDLSQYHGNCYLGIDAGSTTTKTALVGEDGTLLYSFYSNNNGSPLKTAIRSIQEIYSILPEDAHIAFSCSTGYGEALMKAALLLDEGEVETVSHYYAAAFFDPEVDCIVDIGGQDIKAISIDENGAVKNFLMNDKCAAGTGRFLEMMARTLGLSLEEMSTKGLEWKENIVISSMCTVFAESEVVSLVAQNKDVADIIHGLNVSVASKVGALAARLGKKNPGEYMMTGGVAKNPGIIKALEEKLDAKLYICDEAQLCGALGAALFAYEKCSV